MIHLTLLVLSRDESGLFNQIEEELLQAQEYWRKLCDEITQFMQEKRDKDESLNEACKKLTQRCQNKRHKEKHMHNMPTFNTK